MSIVNAIGAVLPRYYFRYRGLVRYYYLVFDVWEDGEQEESDNGGGLGGWGCGCLRRARAAEMV